MEPVRAKGERIRIAMIDDHALYREGLRVVIGREPDLEVVGEAGHASEAVRLAEHTEIDVALVDLGLPGVSGLSVAQRMLRIQPACHVLGLSMVEDPRRIAELVRAGASGFALKSQSTEEIIGAIREVMDGKRYLPPRISHDELEALVEGDDGPIARLTAREREVLELLLAAHSNDAIAKQLFISPRTVEAHRQHIFTKLGLGSVVELVRWAASNGLLRE